MTLLQFRNVLPAFVSSNPSVPFVLYGAGFIQAAGARLFLQLCRQNDAL